MDNRTQWYILWDTSLLPPQEMLPTSSIFSTMPPTDTACITSEHLFGFSPCVATALWEECVVNKQEVMHPVDTTSFYAGCEDFSVLFTMEELVTFV